MPIHNIKAGAWCAMSANMLAEPHVVCINGNETDAVKRFINN
jgi:hypothetical protein